MNPQNQSMKAVVCPEQRSLEALTINEIHKPKP